MDRPSTSTLGDPKAVSPVAMGSSMSQAPETLPEDVTSTPTEPQTQAPEGGCRSSLGCGVLAVLGAVTYAMIQKKKREA